MLQQFGLSAHVIVMSLFLSMLQKKIVNIAHHTHQEIVKMKQVIREKICFMGIDKMVKEAVWACIQWQASNPTPVLHEPLCPTLLYLSSKISQVTLWWIQPIPRNESSPVNIGKNYHSILNSIFTWEDYDWQKNSFSKSWFLRPKQWSCWYCYMMHYMDAN